jgi:hypothetical protein
VLLRLARRHAAVVLPGQPGRAAAHAVTDRITPVPVEPEARPMTTSVAVARLGPSRGGEHKGGGAREKEFVSHSSKSVAAAQSPFSCPEWLPR